VLSKPEVSELQHIGQIQSAKPFIWPAKPFHPACEAILSMMKK